MSEAGDKSKRRELAEALQKILAGIADLKAAFPNRKFTIDGRLVGDLGEIVASLEYDLQLDDVSQPEHDGTSRGRRVQIKATFQDALTFKTTPTYYLGIKLFADGSFEEVYNGPGINIFERYKHRKDIGTKLLSFPVSELKILNDGIAVHDRVPPRTALGESVAATPEEN